MKNRIVISKHCDSCGAPTNNTMDGCGYCDTPYSEVIRYVGPEIKKEHQDSLLTASIHRATRFDHFSTMVRL